MEQRRCFGDKPGQEIYGEYHDKEWGKPVTDDLRLFEFLILEGAQAGLSWYTILIRRDNYRKAFHGFHPEAVAAMTDEELECLRDDEGIIRNRLKIYAARTNARVFLEIQKEFGSFSEYLWSYVNHEPVINYPRTWEEVAVTTEVSDRLSKDLKKRGMKFVGSTIMYAYMQAVGMVNDHLKDCMSK